MNYLIYSLIFCFFLATKILSIFKKFIISVCMHMGATEYMWMSEDFMVSILYIHLSMNSRTNSGVKVLQALPAVISSAHKGLCLKTFFFFFYSSICLTCQTQPPIYPSQSPSIILPLYPHSSSLLSLSRKG